MITGCVHFNTLVFAVLYVPYGQERTPEVATPSCIPLSDPTEAHILPADFEGIHAVKSGCKRDPFRMRLPLTKASRQLARNYCTISPNSP